ncbi:MAG: type I-E CRISPR-associated protein Cse1/CasA [Christensenellales bacterium]|mgnify:FL=1|jgi:CRISPR system Cascade subunit CasA
MMKDIEFNLLDEKWILVRKSDCTVDELSLTDALLKSHEYVELAGELPTQNVSILRLMLAVLHTVFSRYSPQGEPSPLYDSDDAEYRWKELWNAGRLPEKPIRDYLASVHDRFWLFHPDRPFYQTEAAKIGTEYTASKLNGAVSESGNKIRLFCGCTGVQKSELSYSEAARWLLYVNNYDDTSSKPKGKNLPSPGAGWLGKLGLITIRGNNLFETLVYNLILLNHKRNFSEVWGPECPAWEPDVPNTAERAEIPMPDNLSELYTLQSRRLWLNRDDNEKVIGYNLLGGDFFEKVDAFIEPMTVWSKVKGNERAGEKFQPRRHDSSVQMWREFSYAFETAAGSHIPGVVLWTKYIKQMLPESRKLISFSIASVQYGDKDFFVNDVFSDSLTFHTDLLTEIGEHWRAKITDEIKKCDESAAALRFLAKDIELAAGSAEDTVLKRAVVERAREQYYYEIDLPFRNWLERIDPNWEIVSEQEEQALREWHETAKRIALRIGQELVESAGTAAIVGRTIEIEKKKGNKITVHYSAPDAYRYFKVKLNEIYPKEENND